MTLADIIEQYKTQPTPELYKDIIDFFHPLINKLISKYPACDQPDLYSHCLVEIPKAIKAYDKTKGSKATTYIYMYLKGKCTLYAKRLYREIPMEDEYLDTAAPEINIDLQIEIADLLAETLTPLEINIIKLKYGFMGTKTYSYVEINNMLNIRSSFYYHNIAIDKLRKTDYILNYYKDDLKNNNPYN